MALEFLGEAPVEQNWSQLFPYHISLRPGHLYRTDESLDVEFYKTLMSRPLGPFMSAMSQFQLSLSSILERPYLQEALTHLAQPNVANFLVGLAQQHDAQVTAYTSFLPNAKKVVLSASCKACARFRMIVGFF